MTVISDTQTLAEFCDRLSTTDFITVDTEFLREKTYWPKLCLVQVGGPDEAYCIDPLAAGMDLAPLFALFANPAITKVFHAARQDLEIFYLLTGTIPAPLFDTQVAAMVCGFGDQVGYEALASKLAKAAIDKSSRFTDWSHRPLTDKQIDYALADVTHLRTIYKKLSAQLQKRGREDWVAEEMAVLNDPDTYQVNPSEVWRRIKGRGAKPRVLAILREVAAWREAEAQRRDMPRNRLVRDEALMEIAHHAPKTEEALARVRGLGGGFAKGKLGRGLLEAIHIALDVPKADWPQVPEPVRMPPATGPIADLLKVVLKARCTEADVAPKIVASAADIELLAAFGEESDVKALTGWRRKLFGEDALRVRSGELALRIVDGAVQVEPT
ncbi:MAG: ribonuclease D [Magnetospiraceae bacterium]